METPWGIEKIQEILPQRYPFLFVDKVVSFDKDSQKIACLKNVSINDYFFKGHFPSKPIMPGVIIAEALAQSAILLFALLKPELKNKDADYYLGGVDIKFKNPVYAGDQLILEVKAEKVLGTGGIVSVQAKVGEKVAAKGTILLGIKINT